MKKLSAFIAKLVFSIKRAWAIQGATAALSGPHPNKGNYYHEELTDKRIRFVVDNNYALFCGHYKVPFMGLLWDGEEYWTITTNDLMNNAPDDVKRAFWLNRLAHIKLKHQLNTCHSLIHETQADGWAMKNGGDMFKALEWHVANSNPYIDQWHFDMRLRTIAQRNRARDALALDKQIYELTNQGE